MKPIKILSASQQVAEHLKGRLVAGEWMEVMPGEDLLVAELGVGRDTVKAALKHLEREGWLRFRGRGRRRLITLPARAGQMGVRIGFLPFHNKSWEHPFLMEVEKNLSGTGCSIQRSPKGLMELKMNAGLVARMAGKIDVHAWVVLAGSREVLEWFAARPQPVFSIYGNFHGLPVSAAAVDKADAYQKLVRKLVSFGHKRIVMMAREERRNPKPGVPEQAFLDELVACGIRAGSYNLPDWEDHPRGFHEALDKLFQLTPPTALILPTPNFYVAAMQHLLKKGIRVPAELSLVCGDDDFAFDWCSPAVSRIQFDHKPIIRHLTQWAKGLPFRKTGHRQTFHRANFIEDGMIGPVST